MEAVSWQADAWQVFLKSWRTLAASKLRKWTELEYGSSPMDDSIKEPSGVFRQWQPTRLLKGNTTPETSVQAEIMGTNHKPRRGQEIHGDSPKKKGVLANLFKRWQPEL